MTQMTAHTMWTPRPRSGMSVFTDTRLTAFADGDAKVPGSTWIRMTPRVPQRT